jgi:PST family polysaccharide transporter
MTEAARDIERVVAAPAQREWIGNEEIEGGLRRSAVRGWAATAAGQAGKFLITLVSTAIMARILSPGDYGLVAMVTAFLSFIAIFKDLGLSQATVQRATLTEQQASGMFWFNVATGLLLMLIVAVTAPLVSLFYNQSELTSICLAYAAMAPISSLGAQHAALLRRAMRFRSLVIRDLLAASLGASVGIACAVNGFGYWSLVIMQAASEMLGAIVLWWRSGWRPSRPRWSDDLTPMIRFGGALTVSNLLGFVSSGLDSVAIGHLFGPSVLGLYNRAQNTLSRPLKQVLPPIMNVAASACARVAHAPDKFSTAALQLAFIVACISSLVVAIAVVCADWLVLILLGQQWREAVPITRVLALFVFVEPIAALLGTLLTAYGAPGRLVRWRLFSSATVLISLACGTPWGPLGIASAYSLSGLFVRTPLFVWYACRAIGLALSRFFSIITFPLLAGLVAAATTTSLRYEFGVSTNALVSLGVYGSLCTCIYVIVLSLSANSRDRLRTTVILLRHLS